MWFHWKFTVKPFFITTAIDYTNSSPHIGHAYEKVMADTLARYQRLRERDVFFLTGVDQHGQKVQQASQRAGVPPEQFVVELAARFLAVWKKLDISYDAWADTTAKSHKAVVQALLQRLFDEDQLYKATQRGFYSVRQEQFLTEKERGPDGQFGEEWGEVVELEEENYYFCLAKHRDWLLAYIDSHPQFITPEFRRVELRNAVEKLSGDLCISRPKARLAWGIEFPFDPNFVTYVWFDALVNYISFAPGFDAQHPADSAEFAALWPALHVIGKDIMVPAHGVYWPIMLHSLGFSDDQIPPLLVHGWWNISGAKMSKSLGNVVDPSALVDKYGAAAVRYYLVADIVTGKDADFSEERLVQRYNVDLANSVGNLLNRTLNMARKYREGRLVRSLEGGLADRARASAEAYSPLMDTFEISAAIEKALSLATEANQYVEQTKPWALAKEGQDAALDAVLYHLAESLRIIAILLSPVLPSAAAGIFAQLNWSGPMSLDEAAWGRLPDGHQLGAPVPLFPRIEAAAA
ncbi:MAG TPA: methionine--tRNA ligase [Chthoniobacterales bacterium]